MISGPTDSNHCRPRQFYVILDDDAVDSKSVWVGGGDDVLARVTGIILDKRLAGMDVVLESNKCRARESVVKGAMSEAIDSSSWPNNIRVNVRSWHWAKQSAIRG